MVRISLFYPSVLDKKTSPLVKVGNHKFSFGLMNVRSTVFETATIVKIIAATKAIIEPLPVSNSAEK